MSDNPFERAQAAQKMTSAETPMDLMEAAKYSNPRLSELVAANLDLSLQAIRLAETSAKQSTNMVNQMTLQRVAEKLKSALHQAAHPQAAAQAQQLAEDDVLVVEVRKTAQARLDAISQSEQRKYWFDGVPKLVELEVEINRDLVEPLVASGRINKGLVRIWVGPNHVLAVHHVALEVAA
jgi:hypothetical protein